MNNKSDIGKFIRTYVAPSSVENGEFEYYSVAREHSSFDRLIDALIKCNDFDRPDGYFYDPETSSLYVFEHFEFDSSKNTRDGSKLRRSIAETERDIDKEMNAATSVYNSVKSIKQGIGVRDGNRIIYCVGQNGDIYRDNYIDNFKKAYKAHSERLREYIERCKQEIKSDPNTVKTVFIIEDITLGGTYYKNANGIGDPVILLSTRQFIDIFKRSRVDYIIFGRLQERAVFICDRSMIDVDPAEFTDLNEKELYIFPAMPQITCAKNLR